MKDKVRQKRRRDAIERTKEYTYKKSRRMAPAPRRLNKKEILSV